MDWSESIAEYAETICVWIKFGRNAIKQTYRSAVSGPWTSHPQYKVLPRPLIKEAGLAFSQDPLVQENTWVAFVEDLADSIRLRLQDRWEHDLSELSTKDLDDVHKLSKMCQQYLYPNELGEWYNLGWWTRDRESLEKCNDDCIQYELVSNQLLEWLAYVQTRSRSTILAAHGKRKEDQHRHLIKRCEWRMEDDEDGCGDFHWEHISKKEIQRRRQ